MEIVMEIHGIWKAQKSTNPVSWGLLKKVNNNGEF